MPSNTWEDLLNQAEKEGSVEGGGYTPPAPGKYSFVVLEATAQKSKDKTKDQINARIKILNEGSEKGKTMFNTWTISPESPKALNIFFREMSILGADRAFFASNPSMEAIATKLTNAVFEGEVYLNGQYTNLKNIRTASEEARQAALSLASGSPQVAASPTPTSGVPTPQAAPAPAPTPTPAAPAPTPTPAAPAAASVPLPPPPPTPSF